MSVLAQAVGLAVAGAVAGGGAAAPHAFTLHDPRITESSGLAASRAHPGVYWTHNDSDDGPYVYAVDSRTGRTVARVTLRGIHPRDVEAISMGPGGQIYVGDIGDNLGGTWPEVWIYRFREPAHLHDTTVTPVRYTVRYADGPRDAESLMVQPRTGRVYIASKNDKEQGGLYAGPPQLSPSGINVFHRIAPIRLWATDGAFSPDGSRLVLRGYFDGEMYRWHDGRASALGPVEVPLQRQGESVAWAPGARTLMYGSEGRGSSVQPVGLSGKLLPENVAAHDAAHRPRHSAPPQNGNGASGHQQDAGGGKLATAGVLLALAYAAWRGLRRLFRRS